jgi:hypothetical protein
MELGASLRMPVGGFIAAVASGGGVMQSLVKLVDQARVGLDYTTGIDPLRWESSRRALARLHLFPHAE